MKRFRILLCPTYYFARLCWTHLRATGKIIDFSIAWSTFSHVSIIRSFEKLAVRLLIITLIPFTSEFSVSTANVLDPGTSCCISKGSFDPNVNLVLLIVQASEVELPVAQLHVITSPGHADILSHVIWTISAIIQQNNAQPGSIHEVLTRCLVYSYKCDW